MFFSVLIDEAVKLQTTKSKCKLLIQLILFSYQKVTHFKEMT